MQTMRRGGVTGAAPRYRKGNIESSIGKPIAMPAFFRKSRRGNGFICFPFSVSDCSL